MGRDKASLDLHGRSLLASTVETLAQVCGDVLVAGHGPLPDVPSAARYVADDPPGLGPLGGILAGLRRARDDHAIVVACDLPLLNADLLRHLAGLVPEYDAVVPRVGGRAQPLHAVYARAALGVIQAQIAKKDLSLQALLPQLHVRWVEEPEILTLDPDLHSFLNVNTPEAWATALALTRESRG